MPESSIGALVLAAGKGTRMRSEQAKVLHEIFFAPMVHHVLDALMTLSFTEVIVVVGHQREQVRQALRNYPVSFAVQPEQLGTAHAVLAAEEELRRVGTVMIVCGDTPLISPVTLQEMLRNHQESRSVLTVMTTRLDNPSNYGRIVTDAEGRLLQIVEEKDATPQQRQIAEVNAGIYCAEVEFLLESLHKTETKNQQGEFYLTDVVEIARKAGQEVSRFICDDPAEVLGVNSRVELAIAHERLQQRRNRHLMATGVTILQPGTAFISKEAKIGQDTVIHPQVHILGATVMGKECVIEPGAILANCTIGDRVRIGAHAYLEGCRLASGGQVGPQTVLRRSR